jgi:hypothetical protein
MIEAELGAAGNGALTNIDAAVYVAARDEDIGAAPAAPLPGVGVPTPAQARHPEVAAAAPPGPGPDHESTARAARPRRIAG